MKRRGTFMALGAILLAGAAAVFADQPADATITLRVKLELLDKLGAEALEIDVDTVDGAVHLGGDVEKRASVELAGDIAKSVHGVRSVDNDLTLEAHADTDVDAAAAEAEREVRDAALEARVRLALIETLGMSAFEIGTEAADGHVVLELSADLSRDARDRAVAAVRALDGVARVSTVEKRD